MNGNSQEYWANRDGEEHARHVMGAVPWIIIGFVGTVAFFSCLLTVVRF